MHGHTDNKFTLTTTTCFGFSTTFQHTTYVTWNIMWEQLDFHVIHTAYWKFYLLLQGDGGLWTLKHTAVIKYKSCSTDFYWIILYMRLVCFVACTTAPSTAKLIHSRTRWKNGPQTGYVGSLDGENGNQLVSPSQRWENGRKFRHTNTSSMFTSRNIWLICLVAGGNTLVRVHVASGSFSPLPRSDWCVAVSYWMDNWGSFLRGYRYKSMTVNHSLCPQER
jgi:hypothetical protein